MYKNYLIFKINLHCAFADAGNTLLVENIWSLGKAKNSNKTFCTDQASCERSTKRKSKRKLKLKKIFCPY